MNKRTLYATITLFAILMTVLTNCSIQNIMALANGDLKFPKWDIAFNLPVMQKTISMDQMFQPEEILGQYLSDLSDATFYEVVAADLVSGGKYYYPSVSNFGLQPGDYMVEYRVPFPGTDQLIAQGGLDASIDTFFSQPISESIPGLTWLAPVPAVIDLTSADIAPINLSGLSLDVNGDGSSDILMKGIRSQDARIRLTISITDVAAGGATRVPLPSDLTLSHLRIEGTDYHFGAPTSTAAGLVYESTDFLSGSGDFLDFAGDPGANLGQLNIEQLLLTINTDVIPRYVGCTLNIDAAFDFGDDYRVFGDIYPMNFNLGVQPVDTSFLDAFVPSGATAEELLLSQLISSISLDDSAMMFRYTNSLPLSINMNNLFDDIIADVGPPAPPLEPAPIADNQNGGLFAYFDLTGDDGLTDFSQHLQTEDGSGNYVAPNVVIPAWSVGNPEVKGNNIFYQTNSNYPTFIQRTVGTDLRRPETLYFVNNFSTGGISNQDIGIFAQGGGVTIEAGLYIPFALKVLGNREGVDILEAQGFDDFPITQNLMNESWFAVEDIHEFGIDIYTDNQMPVGLTIDFQLIADASTDQEKIISLRSNLDNKTITLESGQYAQAANGEYYVTSNTVTSTQMTIGKGFLYDTSTDNDLVWQDASGDPETFLHFLQNGTTSDLKMKMHLSLLETADPNDPSQAVTVRFSSDNYLTIRLGFAGLMTSDFSKLQ
jgi:hypothetical protein